MSVAGLPSGVTGSLSPTTVTAGGSSTLTLSASATASGSSTYTITGTSGGTTHTASGSLTVTGGGGGGGTLSNGVPVNNLSGAQNSQQQFSIVVPAGQALLTVVQNARATTARTASAKSCVPRMKSASGRPRSREGRRARPPD